MTMETTGRVDGGERAYKYVLIVLVLISTLTVVLWPLLIVRNGCAGATDCDVAHTLAYWVPWFAILVAAVWLASSIRGRLSRAKVRMLAGFTVVWWLFVGTPIVYGDSHTISVGALGLPSALVLTAAWWAARRRVSGTTNPTRSPTSRP